MTVSPHRPSVKQIVSPTSERYPDIFHELGCTLKPDIAQTEEVLARVRDHLPYLRSSPTSWWEENDWILTPQASPLSRSKYDRIGDVSLEQLHIQRTGPQEYVFGGISTNPHAPRHSHAKLREWAIIVLLSSPSLDVGMWWGAQPHSGYGISLLPHKPSHRCR